MATCRTSRACWASLFAIILAALASAGALAQHAPFSRPIAPVARPAKAQAAAPTRTRFIIRLERPVDFKVSTLVNPNRVLVDLPQVKLGLPDPPGETPVGVVRSFQHLSSVPGKVRIVINVTGPVVIERSAIEKAPDGKRDRLVLDIVAAAEVLPAPAARSAGAARLQPPVPRRATSHRRRASRGSKPVIVIDPGHGGHDSGARKFGTIEKDVVLSFSLKLRDKLAATGFYEVLMTRDTDVFVSLHDRRRFAERHMAALFIAIHADYTQRASARGATIYSLRPRVADALARSAENEVRETVLSGKQAAQAKRVNADVDAVRSILTDKARDLIERNQVRTSVLARSVIDFVGDSTNLMENPDRKAGFAVLKTAKVPAILLELGFLTNVKDSRQLNSDEWRDKVSASVVTAINQYMHTCIDMAQC